uniref:Uncharacterized protein n=1 Tax=Arundo donax TaxID=35708 RepID=A0A0A9A207_ARUDO
MVLTSTCASSELALGCKPPISPCRQSCHSSAMEVS